MSEGASGVEGLVDAALETGGPPQWDLDGRRGAMTRVGCAVAQGVREQWAQPRWSANLACRRNRRSTSPVSPASSGDDARRLWAPRR